MRIRKWLIKLAVLIFVMGFYTTADASLTFEWESISGYRIGGDPPIYGWRYSYDIGFYDDTLMVDLDIRLTGADPGNTLRNRWETGIETIWSTDRFSVPISFNVDWVTIGYDFAVNVINSTGRWNMLTWYTGVSGWGSAFHEEAAAHEAGHMLSMWDEYVGGGIHPNPPGDETWEVNSGGLMHVLYGPTLDYYYDPFLDWYEAKLAAIPIPPSILLLSSGLLSFLGIRFKSKKEY